MEKQRTQEELNQEYGNLCAQIGNKIIAIEGLNAEIQDIKKKIHELAEEARGIKKDDTVTP